MHVTSPVIGTNGRARITLEERYLLTRQMHVLQKSGVPLLSGLSALQSQMPSKPLRQLLYQVHEHLLEGHTFSQALGRHPAVFSPMYLGMIRVGETGGLLTEVLEELTRFMEWEIDLRQRLTSAFLYPIIVFATLGIAMAIMAIFVLPAFATMFSSFQTTLPWMTRMLIGSTDFLAHYGWLLALVVGGAMGWIWYFIRTERGRLWWHTKQLTLPVFGPVFSQLAMSRFARVTASLHRAGVPILETLALASDSVNNVYIRNRLAVVQSKVRTGESLGRAMKADPVFPPIVVQMVETGETSGRMDELLSSVSEYYDQQVSYTIKQLITWLEPALVVVVALGVLVLAIAVYVPMWDLVQTLKHTGG